MYALGRPDAATIRRFVAAQAPLPFSYSDVGATRTTPPAGYDVDHARVRLGEGAATFARAVAAVRTWRMFALGWVDLHWPDAPIAVGTTVAVLTRALGVWSLNAARIVYVVDEAERFGFAYGTLPEHAERGEERFTVEWHRDEDEVWYDILAFSRPHGVLATLAYPLARRLQQRFRADSLRAMASATRA